MRVNQSINLKGWLEDHDFALGKGHGKNIKKKEKILDIKAKYFDYHKHKMYCQHDL